MPVEMIANRRMIEPFECAGDVGYPEGVLSLQMRKTSSDVFTQLPARVKYNRTECSVTASISFNGEAPDMNSNGTIIRCVVENNILLSKGKELYSEAAMTVIPGRFECYSG